MRFLVCLMGMLILTGCKNDAVGVDDAGTQAQGSADVEAIIEHVGESNEAQSREESDLLHALNTCPDADAFYVLLRNLAQKLEVTVYVGAKEGYFEQRPVEGFKRLQAVKIFVETINARYESETVRALNTCPDAVSFFITLKNLAAELDYTVSKKDAHAYYMSKPKDGFQTIEEIVQMVARVNEGG